MQVSPALLGCIHRVHLGMCAGFLMLRTYTSAGVCPLVVCSLLLSALSLFPWCVACKYGSISRFKGVFSDVWGCCVGLCCLGVLRGLCGFCVREWLGGLKACCVFAPIFIVLPLFFLFFACFPALLVLFASLVYLCCLCGSLGVLLGFLFPYRIKRKRSAFICALSSLGFGVFILNCLRQ